MFFKLLALLFTIGVIVGTAPEDYDDDYSIPVHTRRRFQENKEKLNQHPCLWVTGNVLCANSYNLHDGSHVVVRFVDTVRGKMDEGYSSKTGYFAVFGCSPNSFKDSDVEVHILHDCKTGDDVHILKFSLPHSVHSTFNITNPIDLQTYYSDEYPYSANPGFPCDPF